MFDPQVIAFAASVAVLTVIPGSDTMLVIRNVVGRGRLAGFATAIGIGSGLFAQAALSALGLSAILMRSAQVYAGVKLAGALYLVGLGVWTIVSARRSAGLSPSGAEPAAVGDTGGASSFAEGLVTNLLNPKVVVFYLAFLPQFISPSDSVLAKSLLLATIHFGMTILWLSTLTLALARFGAWISRPVVRRRVNLGAGTVLAAIGIRLGLHGG